MRTYIELASQPTNRSNTWIGNVAKDLKIGKLELIDNEGKTTTINYIENGQQLSNTVPDRVLKLQGACFEVYARKTISMNDLLTLNSQEYFIESQKKYFEENQNKKIGLNPNIAPEKSVESPEQYLENALTLNTGNNAIAILEIIEVIKTITEKTSAKQLRQFLVDISNLLLSDINIETYHNSVASYAEAVEKFKAAKAEKEKLAKLAAEREEKEKALLAPLDNAGIKYTYKPKTGSFVIESIPLDKFELLAGLDPIDLGKTCVIDGVKCAKNTTFKFKDDTTTDLI